MAIGPVQILVVGFEEGKFEGKIMEELKRLREHDIVRLVDLLFVTKDDDGNILTAQASDLSQEESMEFGAFAGALLGLGYAGDEGVEAGAEIGAAAAADGIGFSDEEVWYLADSIPEGTSRIALAPLGHPSARRHPGRRRRRPRRRMASSRRSGRHRDGGRARGRRLEGRRAAGAARRLRRSLPRPPDGDLNARFFAPGGQEMSTQADARAGARPWERARTARMLPRPRQLAARQWVATVASSASFQGRALVELRRPGLPQCQTEWGIA